MIDVPGSTGLRSFQNSSRLLAQPRDWLYSLVRQPFLFSTVTSGNETYIDMNIFTRRLQRYITCVGLQKHLNWLCLVVYGSKKLQRPRLTLFPLSRWWCASTTWAKIHSTHRYTPRKHMHHVRTFFLHPMQRHRGAKLTESTTCAQEKNFPNGRRNTPCSFGRTFRGLQRRSSRSSLAWVSLTVRGSPEGIRLCVLLFVNDLGPLETALGLKHEPNSFLRYRGVNKAIVKVANHSSKLKRKKSKSCITSDRREEMLAQLLSLDDTAFVTALQDLWSLHQRQVGSKDVSKM
jgi:hypothetical protein